MQVAPMPPRLILQRWLADCRRTAEQKSERTAAAQEPFLLHAKSQWTDVMHPVHNEFLREGTAEIVPDLHTAFAALFIAYGATLLVLLVAKITATGIVLLFRVSTITWVGFRPARHCTHTFINVIIAVLTALAALGSALTKAWCRNNLFDSGDV